MDLYHDALRAWRTRGATGAFIVDDEYVDQKHPVPTGRPLTRELHRNPSQTGPAPVLLQQHQQREEYQNRIMHQPIRNITNPKQPQYMTPPIATVPLRRGEVEAPIRIGPSRHDPMEPQPLRVGPLTHPTVPMYDAAPSIYHKHEAAATTQGAANRPPAVRADASAPIQTAYPLPKPSQPYYAAPAASQLRAGTSPSSARNQASPSAAPSHHQLPHELRDRPLMVDFNWDPGQSDDPSVVEAIRAANIPGPQTAAARFYRPPPVEAQQAPKLPDNNALHFPSQLQRRPELAPQDRRRPAEATRQQDADIRTKYAHRGWTQI